MDSFRTSAGDGLRAMVSCCFTATPSASSSGGSDDEMYMTQSGPRKLPWFLGGAEDSSGASTASTMTSSLDDVLTTDSTSIGPAGQQPPRWIKDDIIDYCMQCEGKFDLFTRKHHCRACGLVFCKTCTSQPERVLKYGFPEPVRVCLACSIDARTYNEFYERHLPVLEAGAVFVKHGMLLKRLVEFKFIRSKLIFQYQTLDSETRVRQNEIKAFTLDSIVDVKQVPIDKENGMLGLLILVGSNEEHRLDASSADQKQQWIAAIESVRSIRQALIRKERERRAKQVEAQNAEMLKMTASFKHLEEKKASFHEERMQKRAEQRELLRVKYKLSNASSGSMNTTTAAS